MTRDVSVIMPTNLDQRLTLVKHCLNFMYLHGYQGEAVVGVWGGHDKIEALQSYCTALSPRIRLVRQDGNTRFTARAQELAEMTTGRFIIQTGDDDFIVPKTLESLVRLLDHDHSVSATQGRMLTIHFDGENILGFGMLPLWSAPEPEVLDRFAQHCRHTGMLLYSLLRRADFLERAKWMDETMAHTKNHVWFDGMAELFTTIKGRFIIIEEVYLLRGKHPSNTSRIFRQEEGDANFPYFLLSADFSPTYKFFESQVFRLLADAGVELAEPLTRKVVQSAMLNLIRGSVYGRPDPPSPEDVHLKAIITQDPPHPVITSMLGMLLRSKIVAP